MVLKKGWRKIQFKIIKGKKKHKKANPLSQRNVILLFDKRNSRRRSGGLKSTIHFIGFYFWDFIQKRVDIFRKKKTALSCHGG